MRNYEAQSSKLIEKLVLLIQILPMNLDSINETTYPTVNIALPQKLFHDIFAKVHYVL